MRTFLITIVHLYPLPAAMSSDAFTYARLYERVLGTIIHLVNRSTAILSARQLSASIVIQTHNSFIWPFDIRVTWIPQYTVVTHKLCKSRTIAFTLLIFHSIFTCDKKIVKQKFIEYFTYNFVIKINQNYKFNVFVFSHTHVLNYFFLLFLSCIY